LAASFFFGAAFFLGKLFFTTFAFVTTFFFGEAFFAVVVFLVAVAVFFFGAAFFLGAVFFVAVFFGAAFFYGAAFFLGAATFFFGSFLGLLAFMMASLAVGDSLYEAFTWINVPFSTPDFNAVRNTCFLTSVCHHGHKQSSEEIVRFCVWNTMLRREKANVVFRTMRICFAILDLRKAYAR
jgi:hypothetical protein